MKFRPLHDRVVVRRIEGEDKTRGGIIIPDTVKEKPQEGEVVAVRPGARKESGTLPPNEIQPGEPIFVGRWAGAENNNDEEHLIIMEAADVGGIKGGAASKKMAAKKNNKISRTEGSNT